MTLMRWTPRTELWDPFHNLADIREEMNRLFDDSFRRLGRGDLEGAFAPAVDIVEHQDHYLVRADLPGLRREDVNVTLQDNFLTIKGEKKYEAETKEGHYYRRERLSGTFARVIELPTSVEARKIEASFKDGVLHVTLPKSEEAKPKEIDIKVS